MLFANMVGLIEEIIHLILRALVCIGGCSPCIEVRVYVRGRSDMYEVEANAFLL